MRLLARFPLFILLCAMLAFSPVFATTYKCVDDNGTTYSNTPCGKDAQEVKGVVSVTPPFVPPERAKTNSGGTFAQLHDMSGQDLLIALLLGLIPLSIIAMVVMSRKSASR